MARFSLGVANTQIPGAAASLRLKWPNVLTSLIGVYSKFGPLPNGPAIGSAGGYSSGVVVYNGAPVVSLGSNNVAFSWYGLGNIGWMTERPGGSIVSDWSCWSIRVTCAFAATGPLVGDFGIIIGCGGNLNNIKMNGFGAETHGGIVFGPTDANVISLRARAIKAGPLTVNTVIEAGFDITQIHTYELRIVTGSPSADPVLFGLIDNTVVTAKIPWTAAAGLLPNNSQGEGSQPIGYTFGWTNQTGLANLASTMYAQEAVITAAQGESYLI